MEPENVVPDAVTEGGGMEAIGTGNGVADVPVGVNDNLMEPENVVPDAVIEGGGMEAIGTGNGVADVAMNPNDDDGIAIAEGDGVPVTQIGNQRLVKGHIFIEFISWNLQPYKGKHNFILYYLVFSPMVSSKPSTSPSPVEREKQKKRNVRKHLVSQRKKRVLPSWI
jgi:hypothetical protein